MLTRGVEHFSAVLLSFYSTGDCSGFSVASSDHAYSPDGNTSSSGVDERATSQWERILSYLVIIIIIIIIRPHRRVAIAVWICPLIGSITGSITPILMGCPCHSP